MLLAAGAGIGVLQEPVCAETMESGRLIQLLPEYTVPGFDLHALFARPIPSCRGVAKSWYRVGSN